jgi:hypothetical protein
MDYMLKLYTFLTCSVRENIYNFKIQCICGYYLNFKNRASYI